MKNTKRTRRKEEKKKRNRCLTRVRGFRYKKDAKIRVVALCSSRRKRGHVAFKLPYKRKYKKKKNWTKVKNKIMLPK